ncbi:MAG: SAM-dependent methyltransferase [Tepidisphaeraceae bacterium]
MPEPSLKFVSRGGLKLEHALATFAIDVTGLTCADLGCSTGGFTDCLLQCGAAKVYAVDTGYGVLDYRLRKDPRVVVKERQNAMHVDLPEKVDFVTIDASWTRQDKLLPNVDKLLKPAGRVVTLVKPHYETDQKKLRKGILPAEEVDGVVALVTERIAACGFVVEHTTPSPILGGQGNVEVLALLRRL